MNINLIIANAGGTLDKLKPAIESSFKKAISETKDLELDDVDVIVTDTKIGVIPELGIGGHSPGPHTVTLPIDSESENLKEDYIFEALVHEFHHCKRWRNPGYGETLGEAIVTEGLACLYEEEKSGTKPIYADVDLSKESIEKVKSLFNEKDYDHFAWFFGSSDIERWFGYTYGYNLCEMYADEKKLSASDLVNVEAQSLLSNID